MTDNTQPLDADGEAAQFPAVFTMHCPNGSTNACVQHARSIETLHQRMWGMRVQATKAPEGSQCDNCINEAKKAAPTQGGQHGE